MRFLVVGTHKMLSMTISGPPPVKGHLSPGNGDGNPAIGNVTTS